MSMPKFARPCRAVRPLWLSLLAAGLLWLPRAGQAGRSGVAQAAPAAATRLFLPFISAVRPVTLVGAGDIADCATSWDEATANLIDNIPGTVITLGDNAYESGTAAEFQNCYGPSWGRFKARTRPTPGNHDYTLPGAAGYFDYFGAVANGPVGYYSYDLGGWHILALNSNCDSVGGCQAGSPQEQWLRADLAAHPAACTLAYWHHPLFSSGPHGNDTRTLALWQALYDYHADVVLSGHDHDYERFAPQTSDGQLDWAHGLREFVVGTGGRHFASLGPARRPNSEIARGAIYGVIQLTLYPTFYAWAFVPAAGISFQDTGWFSCH